MNKKMSFLITKLLLGICILIALFNGINNQIFIMRMISSLMLPILLVYYVKTRIIK